MADPHKTKVYGTNLNADGTPDAQEFDVELNTDIAVYNEKWIIRNHDKFKVTPSPDGKWEIMLIDTKNMEPESKYRFYFTKNKSYDVEVPEQTEVFFGELIK